jgi:hypothetical protein
MELAATENYRVIHYHISSPGRVSRRGDAFEWMEDAVHQRAGSRANASA